MSDQIGEAVKKAIGDGVSVLSWIAGWGNMDDQIGSAVFRFSHKQLQDSGGVRIPFGRRWDNEGDWEIFGGVTATELPKREDPCCRELRQRVKDLERAVHTLKEREKQRRIREAAFSDSATETKGPSRGRKRTTAAKG